MTPTSQIVEPPTDPGRFTVMSRREVVVRMFTEAEV
jgi:hypothetical protein